VPSVVIYGLAAIALLLSTSCRTGTPTPTVVLPVIPAPAESRALDGGFTVTEKTVISVPNDAKVQWTARYFADLLARTRGLSLPIVQTLSARSAGSISFGLDAGDRVKSDEGYELSISPAGIAVSARDPRGLLYGAVTLWQLLTADRPLSGPIRLSAVEIRDAPRFVWRGLMLDSARHYQSPEFIERFIDTMALHKLNTLQWHLTDDQAWRLEIKKYPRLAEVGGWRVPAGAAAQANIDPRTGKPRMIGGIYTQDAVRHLVAYAAARGITIVPEIEMPGHASAAIVAYPQLASTDDPPRSVPSDWGVYRNLYNVEESTFAFLEDVLGEVIAIFPSRYIHIGGDEAVKDQWRSSPRIQERMRELGVEDETKLQSYFVKRIEAFLSSRGRKLIGWDEILEGGIAPNATITSWRGVAGAVTAARAGHDSVLSPDPTLYLDHRQSLHQYYPPGRGSVVSIEEIYAFDPFRADLTPDENAHILGLQGDIWTEHIRTEDRVEYMVWPRAAAVAEVGWSPCGQGNWQGFRGRLVPQLRRYRALGLRNADTMFRVNIDGALDVANARASIALSSDAGLGEIHYTTDGSDPTAGALRYTAPIQLPLGVTIAAASFLEGQPLADVQRRLLDSSFFQRRTSHQLKLCTERLVLSLEDDAPVEGERAVFLIDIMNPCWIYPAVDLSHGATLSAEVGQLPFNFQIGDDVKKIELRAPTSPDGELEVFAGGCEGQRIASLPLAPAAAQQGVTTLPAIELAPRAGAPQDICFRFTQRTVDPTWAIHWVEIRQPIGVK
jgi:hexosaminidase